MEILFENGVDTEEYSDKKLVDTVCRNLDVDMLRLILTHAGHGDSKKRIVDAYVAHHPIMSTFCLAAADCSNESSIELEGQVSRRVQMARLLMNARADLTSFI